MLYREHYERNSARDWELAKYTYEYLDLPRRRRLAFHLHPLAGSPLVAHAHCESASELSTAEGPIHLRAIEFELQEAYGQFMRLYAAGLPPDCTSFLPLRVERS